MIYFLPRYAIIGHQSSLNLLTPQALATVTSKVKFVTTPSYPAPYRLNNSAVTTDGPAAVPAGTSTYSVMFLKMFDWSISPSRPLSQNIDTREQR